ncbi:MAG TPA: RsmE family RNA methyltransferase, partial [Ramlibacter sp.]|nr:RsmE family RNA methyltransferase [Ramlibacter sp.]
AWLSTLQERTDAYPPRDPRWLLSLAADVQLPPSPGATSTSLTLLSGPEGGLSRAEEAAAGNAGFRPITLGPRVLRAETAPLAALARWADPSSGEGPA